MQQQEDTKLAIWKAAMQYVSHRMANALQAIASAREAAHDDTKSSAGDKYETTREMMQQDIARNEKLLMEAQRMEKVLLQISTEVSTDRVGLGSVVETDAGKFFMAVSAGKLEMEKDAYLVVSPESPIGKLFMGKQKGDSVSFNKTAYSIIAVW